MLQETQGCGDPLVSSCITHLNQQLSTLHLGRHVKGQEEKVTALKAKVEEVGGVAAYEDLVAMAVEPHLVVGVLKSLLRQREGGLCGGSSTAICEAARQVCDATVPEQRELAVNTLRKILQELHERDRFTLLLMLDHMAKVSLFAAVAAVSFCRQAL